jgi:hypothetical protein
VIDALTSLQAQTQVELDALLPSVLDKAFMGDRIFPEKQIGPAQKPDLIGHSVLGRKIANSGRISFKRGG